MQLLRPPSEMDHGLVKFGGFWGTWTRKSENGWDFMKFRKNPEIPVFCGNSRKFAFSGSGNPRAIYLGPPLRIKSGKTLPEGVRRGGRGLLSIPFLLRLLLSNNKDEHSYRLPSLYGAEMELKMKMGIGS